MKRAFTLIELLVVIAIIAIVAAIAFPVFARVTKNARRTECVSNLRQIGQAIDSYCGDWDDRYPWAYGEDAVYASPKNRPALCEALHPYVKSDAIFRCPKDIGETFPKDPQGYRKKSPPFYKLFLSSYLWDGVHFGGSVIAGVSVGSFKRPTETVLSGELRPWHGEYSSTDYYFTCTALYNILYCDGHVAGKTATDWRAQEDAEFQ